MPKLKKQQPSSSSVHVNAPLGSEEDKVKKDPGPGALGFEQLAQAKAADLVTLPEGIDGANCANCQWSDGDFCTNPKVNQELKDGADRMCCSLWDQEGTVREWEQVQNEDDVEKDDADLVAGHPLNNTEVEVEQKDTRDGVNEDPDKPLMIDLGSGDCREEGYLGFDLYPYDEGTVVHDLNLGIPLPDASVHKVLLRNALHTFAKEDVKPLLSEIQRVLMPEGQFMYEGPNEIYNYPEWLVLTQYEDNVDSNDSTGVEKVEGNPIFRQTFTRIAVPDAATADDAEPRIGVSQYDMLPADALLAMDALGYSWSDATSSGRGNRLHGYPSQGALVKGRKPVEDDDDDEEQEDVEKDELTTEGRKHIKGSNFALPKERKYPIHDLAHARNALSRASGKPEEEKVRAAVYRKYPQLKERAKKNSKKEFHDFYVNRQKEKQKEKVKKYVPIFKTDQAKQIVYGVVLAPDEVDAQDDWMTADDIEKAAHNYISKSRVIGAGHEKPIDAEPVESYIAPHDFDSDGQYGPSTVKKGSWILGVKIRDPKEWQKVLDGEYTGFSVGGFGLRS